MVKYCEMCGKKFGFFELQYSNDRFSNLCKPCWKKCKLDLKKAKQKKERTEEKELMDFLLSLKSVIGFIDKYRNLLGEMEKYMDIQDIINVLTSPDHINDVSDATFDNEMRKLWYRGVRGTGQYDLTNLLLISQKYGGRIIEDLPKFRDLLFEKYGYQFSLPELVDFLYKAIRENNKRKEPEKYINFKKIILLNNPITKEDYIDVFLKHYGEDYKNNLGFITKLLIEKKIDIGNSTIGSIIEKRKKKLELESFEKSLIEEESDNGINFDLMSGFEFEQYLGDLFTKMGHKVLNTKLSGDQGADLIVERFGEKTAVQAKCYSGTVGNKAIQEVVAAKNHYNCSKALVITTSTFTRSAVQLADSNRVELWDRNKLEEMIKNR